MAKNSKKLPPSKDSDVHAHGQMGQGGDTRRGAPTDPPVGPDERSTMPSAATTNMVHPATPGGRISEPGAGVLDQSESAGSKDHDGAGHSQKVTKHGVRGGVNRVEDAGSDTARLSEPGSPTNPLAQRGSDPVNVEGLHDPNYTAASEKASKRK